VSERRINISKQLEDNSRANASSTVLVGKRSHSKHNNIAAKLLGSYLTFFRNYATNGSAGQTTRKIGKHAFECGPFHFF